MRPNPNDLEGLSKLYMMIYDICMYRGDPKLPFWQASTGEHICEGEPTYLPLRPILDAYDGYWYSWYTWRRMHHFFLEGLHLLYRIL